MTVITIVMMITVILIVLIGMLALTVRLIVLKIMISREKASKGPSANGSATAAVLFYVIYTHMCMHNIYIYIYIYVYM